MSETIISLIQLQELASRDAKEALAEELKGEGLGQVVLGNLFRTFQRTHQPLLCDKQYTALYRTYTNLVTTALSNNMDPGSVVADPPVKVTSIKDGEEIYRANSLPMGDVQWLSYISDVRAMAERFAAEIAQLARSGGDTDTRMNEQQYEAAQFALDHGLTDSEKEKDTEVYRATFIAAMKKHVNSVGNGT